MCVPTYSADWDDCSSIGIELGLFCCFWFCFLGLSSERIAHFLLSPCQYRWFGGYRCSGHVSLINALIGAQIAEESGILPRFFWNSGKFVVAMPIEALDRIVAST